MQASSVQQGHRVTLSFVTLSLVCLVSLVYSFDSFKGFFPASGRTTSPFFSPFACETGITPNMVDIVALANKYFEVWNTHDGTAVGQMFAPEGTLRDWDVYVEGE